MTGAYLLMRWGIKRTPGKTRNAGKVMRLKIPKTAIMPKMVLARREERCCQKLASKLHLDGLGAKNGPMYGEHRAETKTGSQTHRSLHNALNENHAPRHDERLDRVGKGVCLVRPCDVRGRDEQDGEAAVARRVDELVDGPVLEDEADDEHEDAEGPEDGDGGHLPGLAPADPEPLEEKHGEPVDGPEGEDASNGVVACEFPCVADGVAEDLACRAC